MILQTQAAEPFCPGGKQIRRHALNTLSRRSAGRALCALTWTRPMPMKGARAAKGAANRQDATASAKSCFLPNGREPEPQPDTAETTDHVRRVNCRLKPERAGTVYGADVRACNGSERSTVFVDQERKVFQLEETASAPCQTQGFTLEHAAIDSGLENPVCKTIDSEEEQEVYKCVESAADLGREENECKAVLVQEQAECKLELIDCGLGSRACDFNESDLDTIGMFCQSLASEEFADEQCGSSDDSASEDHKGEHEAQGVDREIADDVVTPPRRRVVWPRSTHSSENRPANACQQHPVSLETHLDQIGINLAKLATIRGIIKASPKTLKELFSKSDAIRSGELDRREFVRTCRRQLRITKQTATDEEIERVFHALDTNGDSRLDFAELSDFVRSRGFWKAEPAVELLPPYGPARTQFPKPSDIPKVVEFSSLAHSARIGDKSPTPARARPAPRAHVVQGADSTPRSSPRAFGGPHSAARTSSKSPSPTAMWCWHSDVPSASNWDGKSDEWRHTQADDPALMELLTRPRDTGTLAHVRLGFQAAPGTFKELWLSEGGVFDRHEFLKVCRRRIGLAHTVASDDDIERVFRAIDHNGDGLVERCQLSNFVYEMGPWRSTAVLRSGPKRHGGSRIDSYTFTDLESTGAHRPSDGTAQTAWQSPRKPALVHPRKLMYRDEGYTRFNDNFEEIALALKRRLKRRENQFRNQAAYDKLLQQPVMDVSSDYHSGEDEEGSGMQRANVKFCGSVNRKPVRQGDIEGMRVDAGDGTVSVAIPAEGDDCHLAQQRLEDKRPKTPDRRAAVAKRLRDAVRTLRQHGLGQRQHVSAQEAHGRGKVSNMPNRELKEASLEQECFPNAANRISVERAQDGLPWDAPRGVSQPTQPDASQPVVPNHPRTSAKAIRKGAGGLSAVGHHGQAVAAVMASTDAPDHPRHSSAMVGTAAGEPNSSGHQRLTAFTGNAGKPSVGGYHGPSAPAVTSVLGQHEYAAAAPATNAGERYAPTHPGQSPAPALQTAGHHGQSPAAALKTGKPSTQHHHGRSAPAFDTVKQVFPSGHSGNWAPTLSSDVGPESRLVRFRSSYTEAVVQPGQVNADQQQRSQDTAGAKSRVKTSPGETGKIHFPEPSNAATTTGLQKTPRASDLAIRIMEAADRFHTNGQLTLVEIQAFLGHGTYASREFGRFALWLKDNFKTFDQNRNGTLSLDDLRASVHAFLSEVGRKLGWPRRSSRSPRAKDDASAARSPRALAGKLKRSRSAPAKNRWGGIVAHIR